MTVVSCSKVYFPVSLERCRSRSCWIAGERCLNNTPLPLQQMLDRSQDKLHAMLPCNMLRRQCLVQPLGFIEPALQTPQLCTLGLRISIFGSQPGVFSRFFKRTPGLCQTRICCGCFGDLPFMPFHCLQNLLIIRRGPGTFCLPFDGWDHRRCWQHS